MCTIFFSICSAFSLLLCKLTEEVKYPAKSLYLGQGYIGESWKKNFEVLHIKEEVEARLILPSDELLATCGNVKLN